MSRIAYELITRLGSTGICMAGFFACDHQISFAYGTALDCIPQDAAGIRLSHRARNELSSLDIYIPISRDKSSRKGSNIVATASPNMTPSGKTVVVPCLVYIQTSRQEGFQDRSFIEGFQGGLALHATDLVSGRSVSIRRSHKSF